MDSEATNVVAARISMMGVVCAIMCAASPASAWIVDSVGGGTAAAQALSTQIDGVGQSIETQYVATRVDIGGGLYSVYLNLRSNVNGGAWGAITSSVLVSGAVGSGGSATHIAMELGPNDWPVLAFMRDSGGTRRVRVAWYVGQGGNCGQLSKWRCVDLSASEDEGYFNRVFVVRDASGAVVELDVLTRQTAVNGVLRHHRCFGLAACANPGSWQATSIDLLTNLAAFDITRAPNGDVHLYAPADKYLLQRTFHWTLGYWDALSATIGGQLAATAGTVSAHRAGIDHVAVVAGTSLYHGEEVGGALTSLTLVATDAGANLALIVAQDGAPSIFYNSTTSTLRRAYRVAPRWYKETIDATAELRINLSTLMAVDGIFLTTFVSAPNIKCVQGN